MNRWELLLLALVLWTAIGLAGTALSLIRRERQKAVNGILWIVGIWAIYLAVEFTVAKMQPQRIFALGKLKCFDEMCFSVTGAEEVPSFFGRNIAGDGTRLLRVSVQIENRGHGGVQREGLVHSYLLDRTGHAWFELPGLGSVPLTAAVPAGGVVTSQPVFKVPQATDLLGLVLTHGRSQPGALVIGDSDSLGHRPDVFALHQ